MKTKTPEPAATTAHTPGPWMVSPFQAGAAEAFRLALEYTKDAQAGILES
jgi:hypothetical protein